MANSDKNIVITPNRGLSGQPEVSFTGFGNSSISLKIPDSTTATLNFESSNTNLLSIDSNLSSGSLFKIVDNDLISIFDATAEGDVTITPRQSTSIGGNGLILPRYSTSSLPPGENGLIVYDTTQKCVKLYSRSNWINLTEPPTGRPGVQYENIVRNGLVFYVDASNSSSYPGSGTTWTDLSGVIGNVNINNRNNDWSFTKDPQTGLSCLFNNTNRTSSAGINIPVNNGFNKLEGTIEIWLKPTGDYLGGHGWFNNSDGAIYTNAENWFWIGTWDTSNVLYFRRGNPGFCCNDVVTTGFTNSYPLDVWNCWTITWKVSSGTAAVYKNSSLFNQRTDIPTNIQNTNPTNTGQIFNGHTRGDNMQFKGYCNSYKIYNRALSATEIQQNFNAQRGRFGI